MYLLLFSLVMKSLMGKRTAIELSVHSYIHEGSPFYSEATNSDNLNFYHFILLHKVKVQLELTPHGYIPRGPLFYSESTNSDILKLYQFILMHKVLKP